MSPEQRKLATLRRNETPRAVKPGDKLVSVNGAECTISHLDAVGLIFNYSVWHADLSYMKDGRWVHEDGAPIAWNDTPINDRDIDGHAILAETMFNAKIVDLAHDLWMTDPDVMFWIREHYDVAMNGEDDPKRLVRAQANAWVRDDAGLRTKWMDRARQIMLLRSGR